MQGGFGFFVLPGNCRLGRAERLVGFLCAVDSLRFIPATASTPMWQCREGKTSKGGDRSGQFETTHSGFRKQGAERGCSLRKPTKNKQWRTSWYVD